MIVVETYHVPSLYTDSLKKDLRCLAMNHDLIDSKSQNDEKINELEKSIFEKESRLKEISTRLNVLENRLDFLSEVRS